MRPRWQIGAWTGLFAISVVVGCVLGDPGEPGCVEDADCGDGFACRAGACLRESTGGAFVPTDAGGTGGSGGGGTTATTASDPDAGDASTD